MTTEMRLLGLAAVFSMTALAAEPPPWNARLAAAYLDQRATWWIEWPRAARDAGTFCISCHTALPYALGRQALRRALGESTPAPAEQRILDNVRRRVRGWDTMEPVYNDARSGAGKSAQARSTEAVLNALILARHEPGSPDTARAITHMLVLQNRDGAAAGAWTWLDFHYQPWEAGDSQFWGATLAASALAQAPPSLRQQPATREALERLAGYFARQQAAQPVGNQLALLAISRQLPELAAPGGKAILDRVLAIQQPDGGWSAAALIDGAWKRRDESPQARSSDGYGTAWVAWQLHSGQLAAPAVDRARQWLAAHQDPQSGHIPSASLNQQRDPASDAGRFMSDAATAYAALVFQSIP